MLVLLSFFGLTSNIRAQLDLKQIMSGSNFVGNSPESYYWSADGQSIYFYWNPENKIESSLYEYFLKGQKYTKLSDSLANSVVFFDPSQRDFQRQFMSDEGVLWSIDKMSGNRQVHLQTTNGVFHVQRSKQSEIVLFQQGDQAYSLNTKTGSIQQLTNFLAGEEKNTQKDSSFLEKQQVELFEFIQEKNMKINQGSSAKSIIDLGLKKNYFPIASTDCNLFFVHNKFKQKITNLDKFDINKLLPNSNDNYVYCGYDGTVFTSKPLNLIWHNITVEKIKILPKILNMHPPNYNIFQKILLRFFKFFLNPIEYFSKLKYYLRKLFTNFFLL